MRKLVMVVPVLLIAVACSKSSTPSSSPTEAPATSAPAASAAGGTTVKEADSAKGKILTNAAGMSLYTFDLDSNGTIACKDSCTTTWPPLAFTGSGTPSGADGLATVARDDGSKQVTYNGKPLYNYSGDTKAGDTNGDGFGGKWHLAKVM